MNKYRFSYKKPSNDATIITRRLCVYLVVACFGRRITTSMMKPMIAKRMNGTSQAKSISDKGNIINYFKITSCNKLKLFSICKIEIINVVTVASR